MCCPAATGFFEIGGKPRSWPSTRIVHVSSAARIVEGAEHRHDASADPRVKSTAIGMSRRYSPFRAVTAPPPGLTVTLCCVADARDHARALTQLERERTGHRELHRPGLAQQPELARAALEIRFREVALERLVALQRQLDRARHLAVERDHGRRDLAGVDAVQHDRRAGRHRSDVDRARIRRAGSRACSPRPSIRHPRACCRRRSRRPMTSTGVADVPGVAGAGVRRRRVRRSAAAAAAEHQRGAPRRSRRPPPSPTHSIVLSCRRGGIRGRRARPRGIHRLAAGLIGTSNFVVLPVPVPGRKMPIVVA